jgi:hypothetical protein
MRAGVVAIGVGLMLAVPARAKVGESVPAPRLEARVTWQDGEERREAWIDPRAIVEFDANEAGERAVKALDSLAVGRWSGRARLWRLGRPEAGEALAKLSKSLSRGRFARVFRDAPSSSSRARALTGELVVTVSPDVTSPRKLLGERLLVVVRSLPATTHTFLVRPQAPVDPLLLASRLSGSPGVVSAVPNWWLEGAAK